MIKVREYRGHIRNWEALCEELGIEKACLERAYLLSAHVKTVLSLSNKSLKYKKRPYASESQKVVFIIWCMSKWSEKPFLSILDKD